MIKQGVEFGPNLSAAIVMAIGIARDVYREAGYALVITSLEDDAPGRVKNSKHPLGEAVDLRINHIPNKTERSKIAQRLHVALPGFDVVLERTHIHIEVH